MTRRRCPADDLYAVEIFGGRHEVAWLDRAWRGHVGEVVHRLHVAEVNCDSEPELHGVMVTGGWPPA